MSSVRRSYHVSDEPVPGYRLTRSYDSGTLGVQYWEAEGPDGGMVRLSVATVREDMKEGLFAWFDALPYFARISHPNLISLPSLWVKTADGRLVGGPLADAAAPAEADGDSPSVPLPAVRRESLADLRPVEAIEIESPSMRFKNLRERFREHRANGHRGMPWQELVWYMESVAEAIDFLHQPVHELGRGPQAIVHGDLRPGRMLIVGNTAKLADWANFFRWKAFEAQRRITATGALKSMAYAAPEMLDGEPQAASDRYSLAIVYTALRTGAMPYRKETDPSQMQEVIHQGRLELSRLTKAERGVIEKAIALDPLQRWPTCMDMVRAIQALMPE
jgi:hypothetical protein